MKLHELIADGRRRKGLSLRDLALITGLQSSHLSELETGVRSNPSFRNVVKIAKALGLKLDRLAKCRDVDRP